MRCQCVYSVGCMKNSTELRKRLESAAFPDLGAMMEGYAQAAAELGKGLGEGLKGFKEGIRGISDPVPPAPTVQQSAAPVPPASTPVEPK